METQKQFKAWVRCVKPVTVFVKRENAISVLVLHLDQAYIQVCMLIQSMFDKSTYSRLITVSSLPLFFKLCRYLALAAIAPFPCAPFTDCTMDAGTTPCLRLHSPRSPAPACADAPGSVGSGCVGFPQPAAGSHGAHRPAWRPNSGLPATERSSLQRRGLQLSDVPHHCRPPAGPEPHHRAPSPPAAGLKPPGTRRRRFAPAWVTEDQYWDFVFTNPQH